MRRILIIALVGLLAACSGSEGGEVDTVSGEQSAVVVQKQVEVVSAPAATPGEVEVVGGDEESLSEFIGRALTSPYAGKEGGMRIMIGLLPEDLPFELPIPESSRIIGSIVRGDPAGTEIILDVPLNSEEVISFYHEALIEEGWAVPPEQAYSDGFVSAPWPSHTLCYNDDEVVLNLSAVEIPDEPTDVRIHIQSPAHYSVCDPEGVYGMDESYGLIPSLKPPPGALFLSGGSGSGQDEASATASLKTDLTVEDLANHYGMQLSEEGWTPGERGTSEQVSWSSWTIKDEDGDEWGGVLIILESPTDPEKRYTWFQIDKVR
jgi:hypothetical protein